MPAHETKSLAKGLTRRQAQSLAHKAREVRGATVFVRRAPDGHGWRVLAAGTAKQTYRALKRVS